MEIKKKKKEDPKKKWKLKKEEWQKYRNVRSPVKLGKNRGDKAQ